MGIPPMGAKNPAGEAKRGGFLVNFGHFDGFWLRAAHPAPNGVCNDERLRSLIGADVDCHEERQLGSVIAADKASTEAAGRLGRIVADPAKAHGAQTFLHCEASGMP